MKTAILGGDERMAYLAELMDGAVTFGLEKTAVAAVKRSCSVTAAVMGADRIILPVPAEKNGALNTPLAVSPISLDEVTALATPGIPVFGGMISEELRQRLTSAGLCVIDYYEPEEYKILSADATAEAVLKLLLCEFKEPLMGRKIMVTGFGRIGKLTARRLCLLGADVTVTARKERDLAWSKVLGYNPMKTADIGEKIGEMDAVINTVPYVVMGERELSKLKKDAFIMETASVPGYDEKAAEKLGVRIIPAGGLPGKHFPKRAGEDIYYIIERLGGK